MKKKALRSVSLLGYAMLILAGLQLVQWWDCVGMWDVHRHLYRPPMDKIFFAVTPIILASEMLLALYILQMKEWARRGTLFVLCLYVLMALAMFFSFQPHASRYIARRFEMLDDLGKEHQMKIAFRKAIYEQELAAAKSVAEQESLTQRFEQWLRSERTAEMSSVLWMWITALAAILKYGAWNVVAALYLTRPKVKKSFS